MTLVIPPYLVTFLGVFILVCLGGLVTGLTLGLMSIDKTNLHILSHSEDPQQRKWASQIRPIRENTHLLLVTLLLTSTLVFESLPILVSDLAGGSGLAAVLLSTGLTLIFGEVVPQAICTRHGLRIGAFFAWPVRILLMVMYIVAYPIACLLDWILGDSHGVMYHRAGLKELVAIHGATRGGSLSHDEVTIISGALDLSAKVAADAMTHRRHVFMVDLDSCLDWVSLRDIQRAGHSRIPVFEGTRDNLVGVLLTKSLILLDPEASTPVREVHIYSIPSVPASMSLFDLLNSFQEGACHMAVVMDPEAQPSVPVGIVTLEDVIEELIQEEIVDETDVYIDVVKRIRAVRATNALIRPRSSIARHPSSSSNPKSYSTFVPTEPLKCSLPKKKPFSRVKSSWEGASPLEDLQRYQSLDPESSLRTHLRPGTEEEEQENENTHHHSRSLGSPTKAHRVTVGSF